MEVLLTVLLAAGAASLGALLLGQRSRSEGVQGGQRQLARPGTRELSQLMVGDLVVGDGQDLLVVEVWRCRQGQRSWRECRLQTDDAQRWLILPPDDPTGALLGEPVALPLVDHQPPESFDHGGEIYRLERSGQASVVIDRRGASGTVLASVDCWSYGRPGQRRLWIRRNTTEVLMFAGRRLERFSFEVLPASDEQSH